MKVTINGKPVEFTQAQSLLSLVESFGAQPPYALAVNGQFVPKSQHASYAVNTGDTIDVLSPVQGG